jgi:glycosyltransferase involved in cell wall biosynthesis
MTSDRTVASPREGKRIAYIVRAYPRLSETFIVQEVLQMEDRGAKLTLFAFKDPAESIRNPAVDRVQAPVFYFQLESVGDWLDTIAEHARQLLRSPARYGKALGLAVRLVAQGGPIKPFFLAPQLARHIHRLHIEHLHAHFANKPAAIARYASLLTGVPYSFTAHAKDLYLTAPDSIAGKAVRAQFITTCTKYNADYLRGILFLADQRKVHTVYHGVDTGRFRPGSRASPQGPPSIVSVGRLVPKKGHGNLIAAARILHEQQVPFRLGIYGGGDLKGELQQQIDAADLSRVVRLHGSRTQDELVEAYRKADIFVLAPVVTPNGDRDGIPNVLLEAMAMGLPPVSTTISGIPEVVEDGVNGLLVPSDDPSSLAAALMRLLSSPVLRTQLGDCAVKSIRDRFDATENAGHMALLLGLKGTPRADRIRAG